MDDPMHTLTSRERQVLKLLEAGQGTRQIAEQLRMTPNTVRVFVQRIKRKAWAELALPA